MFPLAFTLSPTKQRLTSADPSNGDAIPAGTTIIAYRGTDALFEINGLSLGGDAITGYGVGAGSPFGEQAVLAVDFYNTVKNLPGVGQIMVTGHSLGARLASYVGALYGLDGSLFDNMTFDEAAKAAQAFATIAYNGQSIPGGPTQAQIQTLLDKIYGGQEPWPVDFSGSDAYATTGELLELALPSRALQDSSVEYLDSYGGTRWIVDLHSQALLVALKYVQENDDVAWHSVGAPLLDVLFNNSVAAVAGADQIKGRFNDDRDFASAMLASIAYSALDPGQGLVFGDTGIRALLTTPTSSARSFRTGVRRARSRTCNSSLAT